MKNISLFIAYFLKYGGIAGVLLSMVGLAQINAWGGNNQLIPILDIIFFLVLFFVGKIWSKKLLKK